MVGSHEYVHSHPLTIPRRLPARSEQNTRIQDAVRIECRFDGVKRSAEWLGPFAHIPRAVCASDAMMVRDRPAIRSDRVARGTFDLRPLRNLLAHAPERLHDEVAADYTDMIYAATPDEIEARRKAFIRKWRLKCRAVADSLEEAGDKLFTFTRFAKSQWKSIRTSNAIERLHEEFKRRIKTQTVLPSAETAAMLFWALLASGQITMRKVDGWRSLNERPSDQTIDLAA